MSPSQHSEATTRLLESARSLTRSDDGIWIGTSDSSTSFVEEMHDLCADLEDGSFWFQHRNRCIVEMVRRHRPSGPIVDLGGGNGYVTRGLREAGIEALVMEPGHAGARNAQRRGLAPVIRGTLGASGFPPESLPAVGLFDVVEHLPDDRAFLREVHQFLIRDGLVYLTVPAYQWLWSNEDEEAGHFRRYTLRTIRHTLRDSGFRVIFSTYFFFPLPGPILLFRAIPTRLGRKSQLVSHEGAHQSARRPSLGARLLKLILNPEPACIKHGISIPFGGSCLVAAQRVTQS
jgi:SAM-dependent methyltransferase